MKAPNTESYRYISYIKIPEMYGTEYSHSFNDAGKSDYSFMHVHSSYFPFLSSLSTLAGYQFLSPHLAITILPTLTEDVDASGLNVRRSRAE